MLTAYNFFLAGLGVLSVVTAICIVFNLMSFWFEKKAAQSLSEGKFKIFLLLFAVTRTLSFAFHNFYQEFRKNLDSVRMSHKEVVDNFEAQIAAADQNTDELE